MVPWWLAVLHGWGLGREVGEDGKDPEMGIRRGSQRDGLNGVCGDGAIFMREVLRL